MGIINNRFINAFLDALPSPKKKSLEPVLESNSQSCNGGFALTGSTLVAPQVSSFGINEVRARPTEELFQRAARDCISEVEVMDHDLQEIRNGVVSDLLDGGCEDGIYHDGQCVDGVADSYSSDAVLLAEQHDKCTEGIGPAEWDRVTRKLRKFYGEKIYGSWLKFMSFKEMKCGQVFLSVPTGFIKEWITVNYLGNILGFLRNEDPTIISIEISVNKEHDRALESDREELVAPFVKSKISGERDRFDRGSFSESLSSSIDRSRTFDSFVVGKSNELAFTASKRVAEAAELPIPGSNPLFLYGGVGLGKTHLMHAIVWHIKANYADRRVIYLSAEKFMHKYITALKNKDMMSFKQIFRSVDVLMVDDVQFISGKESTQEEFFHTFNALIEQNKQLVISADRSPSDLQGVEERIQSRLSWGLVADINQTTFELRVGILESKLEQMKSDIVVPKKVVEFMARNIVSNVRELEGALNKVIAHSEITGSVVTVDSAKDLLADILRTNSVAVTLENILAKVSEYFGIKISDLKSQRRVKDVAYARQMCMFLAKTLTQRSLIDIGKFLGGRDHATVIHSVRKIEILIKNDARVAEDVRILTKRLT
ncbi:chromosomal replication initiator protein DnaA [Neorickettsia risticii]|uniref:Chromosomal replication initiator protein DnaA n=1 Tax=Neorickettsia risticii (strain Illinois) TaxID=434131 RepID=C6V4C4_NEORI|nr:chromosomal replication initiator protein DnaA [Neorickettsia risticii str. Illinois]